MITSWQTVTFFICEGLTARYDALNKMNAASLPIPKGDFIKLVELCLNFGSFTFNDVEYNQHQGLAMGSPLSPVAACFYMEMLENDHFESIMGEGSYWMRYVDDVIVISPEDTDLDDKLARLNEVDPKIQFTIEKENNMSLPFLDTVILRGQDELKFKVYRKDTNKEDYLHFYSAHSSRVKSGVIIGFYLRAYRVCSEEYLNEELEHIQKIFTELRYPKVMLTRCRQKAKKIRGNTQIKDKKDKKGYKVVVVPDSKHLNTIAHFLKPANVVVLGRAGRNIGQSIRRGTKQINEQSIVYKIPCRGCPKPYYGETGRGLNVRLKEHRKDLQYQRPKTIVKHSHECGALPDWERAKSIKENIDKKTRIALEAAVLEVKDCMNPRTGRITLSETASKVILAMHDMNGDL